MKINESKFSQLNILYENENLTDKLLGYYIGYYKNNRDSIGSYISILHDEMLWVTIHKKEDNWYLIHTNEEEDEDCVTDEFYKLDGFDEVINFIKKLSLGLWKNLDYNSI